MVESMHGSDFIVGNQFDRNFHENERPKALEINTLLNECLTEIMDQNRPRVLPHIIKNLTNCQIPCPYYASDNPKRTVARIAIEIRPKFSINS